MGFGKQYIPTHFNGLPSKQNEFSRDWCFIITSLCSVILQLDKTRFDFILNKNDNNETAYFGTEVEVLATAVLLYSSSYSLSLSDCG